MCCACYRYAAYGHLGFTGGTVVQKPPANAGDTGDTGLIPGSGRSSGGGYGNPLLYSCLENPMDRGAWWATVHRVTESRTQLSTCARMLTLTYTCTHTRDHLSNNDLLRTGRGSTSYFYIIFTTLWLYASAGTSEPAFLPTVTLAVPH